MHSSVRAPTFKVPTSFIACWIHTKIGIGTTGSTILICTHPSPYQRRRLAAWTHWNLQIVARKGERNMVSKIHEAHDDDSWVQRPQEVARMSPTRATSPSRRQQADAAAVSILQSQRTIQIEAVAHQPLSLSIHQHQHSPHTLLPTTNLAILLLKTPVFHN